MGKKMAFWKADWFLGLAISLLVLLASGSDLLQGFERKAYDLGIRATSLPPSDKVAVIAIDKRSLDNLGRWPWPRDVMADMIDRLSASGAQVIATTVLFSEPQRDRGFDYLERLQTLQRQAVETTQASATDTANPLSEMGSLLDEAVQRLDTDRRLAASMAQTHNVVLPMLFQLGSSHGRPSQPLPDFMQKQAIGQAGAVHALPASAIDALVIAPLGQAAAALGHLNAPPDVDGGLRSEPLVVNYFDTLYPALSLAVAARSLNLMPAEIHVQADAVKLGKLRIATDALGRMNTFFYQGNDATPAIVPESFFDVVSGKVPLDRYRDKIVLIGPTAAGLGSVHPTPVDPAMSDVMVLAHTVSSLLSEHFIVVPEWAAAVELGVLLLIALYLTLLLPRLGAGLGAAVTATLLTLLLVSHFVLMTQQLVWIQLMVPTTLLLLGHLLLTTKRFLVVERGKEKSEQESSESNRMLALAFQGQGQLDMAFDKFRKCTMDEGLMENLYNLALDFERKRQFNKAEAVFRHMAGHDPKFRDLEQRLNRARQLAETVMLGAGSNRPGGSLIDADGNVEKPMLGRYQIEKELGKGAMGVVYLGRDPKINRTVAIKTLALAQEFEGDELTEAKQRFFREAETAGRLNHPNIVTMYDAGEEQDLAYIAMEFLKGRDLVEFTKPNHLLPAGRVLSIIARVAEALAYAHENSVVHRDVKPANIMYEPEGDIVKVTDFGIARITDSSKTKTGMVLGTPSFMSPEQLTGQKIDGRSDLFSLGVTLYQLLSGRLPFEGDSMAQLMFRIANEPHPDIRQFVRAAPDELIAIINRALTKDVSQRYQNGHEMAKDLRNILARLAAAHAAKAAKPAAPA